MHHFICQSSRQERKLPKLTCLGQAMMSHRKEGIPQEMRWHDLKKMEEGIRKHHGMSKSRENCEKESGRNTTKDKELEADKGFFFRLLHPPSLILLQKEISFRAAME